MSIISLIENLRTEGNGKQIEKALEEANHILSKVDDYKNQRNELRDENCNLTEEIESIKVDVHDALNAINRVEFNIEDAKSELGDAKNELNRFL